VCMYVCMYACVYVCIVRFVSGKFQPGWINLEGIKQLK
jgi:hypothetical protein